MCPISLRNGSLGLLAGCHFGKFWLPQTPEFTEPLRNQNTSYKPAPSQRQLWALSTTLLPRNALIRPLHEKVQPELLNPGITSSAPKRAPTHSCRGASALVHQGPPPLCFNSEVQLALPSPQCRLPLVPAFSQGFPQHGNVQLPMSWDILTQTPHQHRHA